MAVTHGRIAALAEGSTTLSSSCADTVLLLVGDKVAESDADGLILARPDGRRLGSGADSQDRRQATAATG